MKNQTQNQMNNSTANQSWVSGQFFDMGHKKFVMRADGKEFELASGMDIEVTLGESLLKGRIGMRDDGLYFLGRMPMFAIPFSVLGGVRGRIAMAAPIKKSA